jgi:NAD(P)-dependent dehydrogenase (short-subunit alcohol dehydrogenase family)
MHYDQNQHIMDSKSLNANGPLPVHRLNGRVALITGGAGKIGTEAARRVLREGANVSLIDIDAKALESAVEVLKSVLSTGQTVQSRILTIVADVTKEAEVESYVKRTVRTFGRLDTAFLNVEVHSATKSLFEASEEDFDGVIRDNVKSGISCNQHWDAKIGNWHHAAFLGLKHTAAAMRDLKNGGSIILTSSVTGMPGTPGLELNASSRSALQGLATTAADELGKYSIRVNIVHPSGLDTNLHRQTWSSEQLEELKDATPLGRFARVDDVASVVAFLASEDSKFMTGGFLKIDGGVAGF